MARACRAGQMPGLAEGGDMSEGTDAIAFIEAFKVHQGGSDMSHGGSAGDRCLSHVALSLVAISALAPQRDWHIVMEEVLSGSCSFGLLASSARNRFAAVHFQPYRRVCLSIFAVPFQFCWVTRNSSMPVL